ncbi:ABC transporter ATP-binding protein/permease [Lachnospiraceae bacterium OttesenSCG-928-D06]|nr:ABC transporter ATP-binding protein/permease [Lachnospiraceae bacterium OttesenSCG-928-D06]
MTVSKEKKNKLDFLHVLKVFIKLVKLGMPQWIYGFVGVTIIGLGSYGYNLFMGIILSTVLNHFEEKTSATSDIFLISGILFLATLVMAVGYIFNLYSAMGIRAKIQRKLLSAWIRQSERFVSKKNTSESMTIITSDTEIVEDFYFQGLMTALFIPAVQGIVSAITIAFIDWRLLMPSLVTGVISLIVSVKCSLKVQETNRILRNATDKQTQSFQETIKGNITWRMLGTTEKALAEYEEKSEFYARKAMEPKLLNANIKFVEGLLKAISTIVFLGIGIWLSTNGSLTFASIMLVYSLTDSVAEMMNSFGGSFNYIVSSTTAGERVLEVLDWPGEEDPVGTSETKPEFGVINFKNISFGYDVEKTVLKGISFQILPGQRIALVGDSGGGKSTILQLLLRFYEPNEGTITLKEKDARNYSLEDWRKNIVYLEQNAPLLVKSISENIAMGVYGSGINPSKDEIIKAAKAAGAHDFIENLPEGYDTLIEEGGSNLSGGQKQRIALARAFLSKAPLLLLDEPTAALDTESERVIQQSLETIMREKTVVIVAHRLETIRNADCILVLSGGEIVEQGSHEELLGIDGLYAGLYKKQQNIF